MNSRYWSPHLQLVHHTSHGYAIAKRLTEGGFVFQLNKHGIRAHGGTELSFSSLEAGAVDQSTYGPYSTKKGALKIARELYV